jgi:uncharacterized protein
MSGKHPKRTDRSGVDRAGRTPLHYAAADGSADRVRELLLGGAIPSAPDDDGWTPLHFAAQVQQADVVQLLLEAGADPNAPDANGNTPLHRATFDSRGRAQTIALLCRAGADPHRPNMSGISPAQLAREIGNYDVRQHYTDLAHGGAPGE